MSGSAGRKAGGRAEAPPHVCGVLAMPARPELRGKKGPMNSTDTIVQEIVIHAPAERVWGALRVD